MSNERTHTPSSSGLARATDYLLENNRIGIRISGRRTNIGYVKLETQSLQTALVELYAELFHSRWLHLKSVADLVDMQPGIPAWKTMAKVYISHWMKDLYSSIRLGCKKVSLVAFCEKFMEEIPVQSHVYDEFLAVLTVGFRPTDVKGIYTDTVYIPYLVDDPQWNNEHNPFNLDDFELNMHYFRAILGVVTDKSNGWNVSVVSNEAEGQPFWLFDWHDPSNAYAWFPLTGNYSLEDVCIACIIGVACTRKLGPRDVDEWQQFDNNIVPEEVDVSNYTRSTDRSFFGASEVRTISVDEHCFSAQVVGTERLSMRKRKARTDEEAERLAMDVEYRLNVYQITDWVYRQQMIFSPNFEERLKALILICINLYGPTTG